MPPAKRNAALDAIQGETPPASETPEVLEPTVEAPSKPTKKYAKVMLYTHPKVARKLKEIALVESKKANDVILEALDLYFAKAGHTGIKHVIEK